jgi:Domain of unknown function (DUF1854)
MSNSIMWQLSRNAFGRLVYLSAEGETFEGVAAVRAFPISAPGDGVALVAGDGRELAWIENLNALPAEISTLICDELARREFMPLIQHISKVSSFATPSTWRVDTDRGETSFVLRGEEDIRRVGPHALLIADSHGIQFLIPNLMELDIHSRRILDRFL